MLLLLLCCVGGVVLYVVGLPRFRDEVRDPIEEAISTEVARQIAIAPDEPPAPGTYTLRDGELNQALRDRADRYLDIDDMNASIYPDGVIINVTIADQTSTYEGDVAAIDGELRVLDMSADGGFGFVLPGEDMAELIEDGINNYFSSRDLMVTDVELGDGVMTLTVAPAV
jgi:hypothetical protein